MYLKKFYVNSRTSPQIHNITVEAKQALRESQAKNGLLLVLVTSGTAGVTLLENDIKIKESLQNWLMEQFPETEGAKPKRISHSGKDSAHLRAALLSPSLALPVERGLLAISPWQEIILMDFEEAGKRREFQIQILSENPGGGK
ncbi:MAG: secondary thiamine-phosphate synthase enzyme YjbQ [Deltaproteobacteria bacterium]|nr:secondary thiamine-phosphate synthase enzyme YjbQ [Deltaproteobacteria bacterium]